MPEAEVCEPLRVPTLEHASGNWEVIEALEDTLKLAREGKLGFLIVAGADNEQRMLGGYVGDLLLHGAAMRALDAVMRGMAQKAENMTPPFDEALGCDHVCYNVPYSPLCFDFLCWLVDAEMRRIREKAPAPLKVGFFFGRDGKVGIDGDALRQQMFENVVRPALALIGAVEDPSAVAGHGKPLFVPRDIVAAARNGEKVPLLQAPPLVRAEMATWAANTVGLGPVVITLRESGHWTHRNSNLEAWLEFARYLRFMGEKVIFVRDTAKADEPLEDFATCPRASRDLHSRMALYELAKVNMLSSNGPIGLLLFSRCPWLQFIDLKDDGFIYTPDTPRFWKEKNGVDVGGQYPWSLPTQRIVWAADTFDNIVSAWEAQPRS